MTEILIPVLIIAITAVMLGGLGWSLRQKRPLASLIFGICLLYEIGFVDMPMTYSLLTGFKLERQMQTAPKPSELATMLLGEFIYVTAFAGTFVMFESMRDSDSVASQVKITGQSKRLLMVLGCIGAAVSIACRR
jgi:NAD/NADP transhydrogenase beta subunit